MEQEQTEIFPGNRIVREVRVINSDDQRYDRFVDGFFLFNCNLTKAAKFAGYSEASAYSQGSRLMTRPEVVEKIEARRAEELEGCGLAEAIRGIGRIMRVDPRRIFDDDGLPRRFVDLDEDIVKSLQHFTIDEETGRLKTWKFYSRAFAQEQAMRLHGAYDPKGPNDGAVTWVMDM